MNGCDMLLEAKRRFIAELESRAKDGGGCCELSEEVIVSAPLTSREAIRNPGRDDFPILKGKEVLMQPALLEALVEALGPDRVMVSDLAEAGKVRCGVKVLDGTDSSSMFECCQIVLVTGSTIVNGTVDCLTESAKLHKRRVVFYGTTIAGAAHLLGLERWCPCSM
jgi:hypothetical protein